MISWKIIACWGPKNGGTGAPERFREGHQLLFRPVLSVVIPVSVSARVCFILRGLKCWFSQGTAGRCLDNFITKVVLRTADTVSWKG